MKQKKKGQAKHLLIVSQYFYPEPFRINDMAAEWAARGYKVTVLTGIPNYPEGRFYQGYGYGRRRREIWKGVEIIRIPLLARGSSALRLAANYVSFVVSGFIWNMITDLAADYVFTFEVSPMTQALVGVWYANRHSVPHYLYVQDLWPENIRMVAGIRNPAVIGPIERMVDYIYRNSDEIFTTSPSFARAVCNRKVRVSQKKVHYWPQYAEDCYQPKECRTARSAETGIFKIVFAGNIGYAQGLDILPKAARRLKKENVKFIIVGDGRGKQELCREIEKQKVKEKFILLPRRIPEKIPEILAMCDVAFLSLMDTRLLEMTIPAKLQAYMACGMPILAAASGEAKRIIEKAGCGICTGIGDSAALAAGIRKMMQADRAVMGMRARQYYKAHFDRKKLLDWFEQHFLDTD